MRSAQRRTEGESSLRLADASRSDTLSPDDVLAEMQPLLSFSEKIGACGEDCSCCCQQGRKEPISPSLGRAVCATLTLQLHAPPDEEQLSHIKKVLMAAVCDSFAIVDAAAPQPDNTMQLHIFSHLNINHTLTSILEAGMSVHLTEIAPMSSVLLRVKGMKCAKRCGGAVVQALKGKQEVQAARVVMPAAMAVAYAAQDAVWDAPDLVRRIADAGFEASALEDDRATLGVPRVFKVTGMRCQKNCASKVKAALEELDGARMAEAWKAQNGALLWGTCAPEAAIAAIEPLGYTAEVASPQLLWGADAGPAVPTPPSSAPAQEQADQGVTPTPAAPVSGQSGASVELLVEGMSCASCSANVEKSLRALEGVQDASVSLMTHSAHVTMASAVPGDVARLVAAVEAAGYKARLKVSADSGLPPGALLVQVTGMSCASCANAVESAIQAVPGVISAAVNPLTGLASVTLDDTVDGEAVASAVMAAVVGAGYEASLAEDSGAYGDVAEMEKAELLKYRTRFFWSLVFVIPLVVITMGVGHTAKGHQWLNHPLVGGMPRQVLFTFPLTCPVLFWVGQPILKSAAKSLRAGFGNMDTLISVGTLAAFIWSLISNIAAAATPAVQAQDFFETSALLVAFVNLGKLLEVRAKGQTSRALSSLGRLQAKDAIKVALGPSGEVVSEVVVPVDQVHTGDFLLVLPGSRVPTDGVVASGVSAVDESMVTGESVPVERGPGDKVIGGTTNVDQRLIVRATHIGADSLLAGIIRLVGEAQAAKAPIQRFADRISAVFVPAIILMSLLTFVSWLAVGLSGQYDELVGSTGMPSGALALTFAVAVVVVACPCALGLATPTAVMVGVGVGAKRGILIKGGPALESSHRIRAVLCDKTGTLTHGRPAVTEAVSTSGARRLLRDVAQLCGSLERDSVHPMATAVVAWAEQQCGDNLRRPESFQSHAGKGVEGTVDGYHVAVGTLGLMEGLGVQVEPEDVDRHRSMCESGCTVVVVTVDRHPEALISLKDQLREDSVLAVRLLQDMGVAVWMVTGDNATVAKSVARDVGIPMERVLAGVLPGDKADAVLEARKQSGVVAFVGDGINDAPALAAADVGIAIGAGTEAAMDASDVVLLRNSLVDVVLAISLSHSTFRRIQQNFVWAVGYNALAIPFASGALLPALGWYMPPWLAGAAMAMSSVSVVLSSLTLNLWKPPRATREGLLPGAKGETVGR